MSNTDQPPDTVWVRHRGELHEIPAFCPDLWPFSSVLAHRNMAGRPWLDPRPFRILSVLGDGEAIITGAGTQDDPMHSEQLENRPLGVCQCDEARDELCERNGDELSGAEETVD